MKWSIILIATLLWLAHLILETSEIMDQLYPSLRTTYIRPIISQDFRPDWYVGNGINYLWWIKYNCDDIVWCLTYLTMARIAFSFNFRLFCIVWMFFLYHVLDYVMLWWNFKTSHWIYWLSLSLQLISIIIIVVSISEKMAIVRSINQKQKL